MSPDELDLKMTSEGVLLPVHAHPGARKNQITGVHDGRLKISVTQAPEQGKANRVIQEMLAEAFDLARNQVMLVSGAKSSRKIFSLAGLSVEETRNRHREIFVRNKMSVMNKKP